MHLRALCCVYARPVCVCMRARGVCVAPSEHLELGAAASNCADSLLVQLLGRGFEGASLDPLNPRTREATEKPVQLLSLTPAACRLCGAGKASVEDVVCGWVSSS